MGTAGRARAHFQVLKDMGVLISAADSPDLDAGGADVPVLEHVFSGHTPLWAYEQPFYAHPVPGQPPVFQLLDPNLTLDEVLAQTRFVTVVGASRTPVLQRLLAEPGVFVLIFEHDPSRLGRFLALTPPAELANKAFVFLGRPQAFTPPLSAMLGREAFRFGFPVFYAPQGADGTDEAFAREVAEYVENLFFRECVYPLSSQSFGRSIPFRDIAQELFYDQLVHAYENLPDYAACPDIDAIKGQFPGETAILVAAGADLAGKLDYLRANQDRAVVIAVNSALKTLVAAGIKPQFCVVNDTSLQVSRTFEGLPLLRPVMLVAHSLSHLGGAVFPQKFLFGAFRPDVFGPKPNLRLHGSVLTTAFSLARHLGCKGAVLVGAQLSSSDPWSLSYVSGESGRGVTPDSLQLTQRWPQLYPVRNRFGQQRYTSLNFLDVKHWLAEEIRQSGLRVVNTTRETIIDMEPVEYDEAPAITPTGRLAQALRQAYSARRRAAAFPAALGFARAEAARHRACLGLLDSLEGLEEAAFLRKGGEALAVFDANNVSYLVQRFEDFNQAQFHFMITAQDPAEVVRGLRYHFSYARRMLCSLVGLLDRQEALLRRMAAAG
ncbi:MAG: DUF115 domain-containing protein [Proteobacteria bacterium]|nr:DUF115 domain-containing protein [Pseudomonadota bacterium]MBU1594036.1 DUF115 domain-containing protein [Pseudomonadota bacterium]